MVEDPCFVVERFSSAIEMAFTTNLALALWAVLWNRFRKQHAEFSEAADALERNEKFQETIGLRRFRNTLRWGLGVAISLWWLGLAVGLGSAVFLYLVMWHEGLCHFVTKPVLLWAAYTFPGVMVVMTAFGLSGNRLAESRMKELKTLEFKTSEEYAEAVRILEYHQSRHASDSELDLD